jgi:hypothetical protein
MDISPAALELGRMLFERNPVMGQSYPPRFQVFDGQRIDLPSESIDDIVCFDAFHHVPNPGEVLLEMGRVLRPGGRAGFSEPGPRHSLLPQSQYEMRNFGVIENDIVMSELAQWAERAGFQDVRIAVFDADTYWCSPKEFDTLSNPVNPQVGYLRHLRSSLANRRLFILQKPGTVVPDSRDRTQLGGELELTGLSLDRDASASWVVISGACRAMNTGAARWLPSESEIAPVRLGARMTRVDGAAEDLARFPLPGDGVDPGKSCEIPFRIEIPADVAASDGIRIEIDLVSEGITWFAIDGSQPLEIWPRARQPELRG